ncbi:hypothetical protein, partial [Shimia sp.]|uniref:hypothetical protein n=1 Tax=Shimia sp. TaxID=1954381 RepID=UPI0032983115
TVSCFPHRKSHTSRGLLLVRFPNAGHAQHKLKSRTMARIEKPKTKPLLERFDPMTAFGPFLPFIG